MKRKECPCFAGRWWWERQRRRRCWQRQRSGKWEEAQLNREQLMKKREYIKNRRKKSSCPEVFRKELNSQLYWPDLEPAIQVQRLFAFLWFPSICFVSKILGQASPGSIAKSVVLNCMDLWWDQIEAKRWTWLLLGRRPIHKVDKVVRRTYALSTRVPLDKFINFKLSPCLGKCKSMYPDWLFCLVRCPPSIGLILRTSSSNVFLTFPI